MRLTKWNLRGTGLAVRRTSNERDFYGSDRQRLRSWGLRDGGLRSMRVRLLRDQMSSRENGNNGAAPYAS
jgi:hypothetical protein